MKKSIMWKQYPEKMAIRAARRAYLIAAIKAAGVDPTKPENFRPAGAGEIASMRTKEDGQPRFFITLKGLERLAEHLGLDVK